jgi:hypothetical protein
MIVAGAIFIEGKDRANESETARHFNGPCVPPAVALAAAGGGVGFIVAGLTVGRQP